MRVKKIFFEAASIIKLFIILKLFVVNCSAEESNIKYFSQEKGTIALMYHRFDEQKYPSTNIQMNIFKKQIELIKENNYEFYDPGKFKLIFETPKKRKKILITIDDAFSSFYENAWPFLKENEIPFILFVSTEAVGNHGYMTWDQIKEIEKENFVYIGNHSHSHDYLIDLTEDQFLNDINMSIKIFEKELNYNPIFFSYPFGEYSKYIKNYISKKFKYSFGQHSGVIDINKNKFELPRFPINEEYGDLKRFKFLIDLETLQFKKLLPDEKLLNKNTNPPNLSVHFFENQNNLKNINCFSNEGNKWNNSNIIYEKNILRIKFAEKFLSRRGRVNCSLNDNGVWRWFGIQFSIKQN